MVSVMRCAMERPELGNARCAYGKLRMEKKKCARLGNGRVIEKI